MPLWLLSSPFNGERRIADGQLGITFAIRLRLGAFLHQPFGGVGNVPTPRDYGHAENEVGPRYVGACFFAVRRRAVHTSRIARPFTIGAR